MLSKRNKQISAIQRRKSCENYPIERLDGRATEFALKHQIYKLFSTIRDLLFLPDFHNLHSIQYASRNGHFSSDKSFVHFFPFAILIHFLFLANFTDILSFSTFIHFFPLATFIHIFPFAVQFHLDYRRKNRHQYRKFFRLHPHHSSLHTSLANQAKKSNCKKTSERIRKSRIGRGRTATTGPQDARTAGGYGARIARQRD